MIGDLPIPISRAPSSMSIPAATIVADQDQIKPLLGREKSETSGGNKAISKKKMKWKFDPIIQI